MPKNGYYFRKLIEFKIEFQRIIALAKSSQHLGLIEYIRIEWNYF